MAIQGPLDIWHVAREFGGLAEAGGVKDAVQGLAAALAREGHRVTAVIPLYGFLRGLALPAAPLISFSVPMPDQDAGNAMTDEPVRIFPLERDGVRVLLVDSPRFAEKNDVYTHTAADEAENPHKKKGTGHWDFHQMNLLLQRASLEAARGLGAPDVFHCHDGHAAFLPAIVREDPRFRRPLARSACIVTIHNAGVGYHQDIWDRSFARLVTGLPDRVLERGMLRGTVDPLLLSALYARLTTVSEQYARELLGEGEDGMSGGLGPALRAVPAELLGITNGVDPAAFDPRPGGRSGIPYPFDPSRGDWAGKRLCRERLCGMVGLPWPSGEPLFGFIGRLTPQKGIDVLSGALSLLLEDGDCPQVALLGQGAVEHEERLQALTGHRGAAIRMLTRFDAALARLIYASSDFLLIPSAYEPCGLTDFHAQLVGTVPLVHSVGGLVKVRDGETGFSYREQTPRALAAAVRRCITLSREEPGLLEDIRRRAFTEIFESHTWDRVARDGYLPLYRRAAAGA